MRADAPGKLVISGAYAVLCGAPAIATAVSRRVVADSSRPAEHMAQEVMEGIRLLDFAADPPWYDASALRHEERKLGLGSSAAICVASLGALQAEHDAASIAVPEQLRELVYPLARKAHCAAQGGGSGIDIAASCFGGTLLFQGDQSGSDTLPHLSPVSLPSELTFEVWASRQSASTSDFVARVFELKSTQPAEFARAMTAQERASVEAATTLKTGQTDAFLAALREQFAALGSLGRLAGLPIVLPELHTLAGYLNQDACLLPSGAGGGDVNLHVSRQPSSEAFRNKAEQLGFFLVPLQLGDEGLRVLEHASSLE